MEYIREEDRQNNFVDIGPVNKVYNMLCVYVAEGRNNRHPDFLRHSGRIRDYLWVAEDGMKMQGYNGSQTWDTSFAIQAVVESGLAERFPRSCVLGNFEKNHLSTTCHKLQMRTHLRVPSREIDTTTRFEGGRSVTVLTAGQFQTVQRKD